MKITITKDGVELQAIATPFRNLITRRLTIEVLTGNTPILIDAANLRSSLRMGIQSCTYGDITIRREALMTIADDASAQITCTLRDVVEGDRVTMLDGQTQKVHFIHYPSDAAAYVRSDHYTTGCWLSTVMTIVIEPIAVAMDDRQPQYARKVERVGRSVD